MNEQEALDIGVTTYRNRTQNLKEKGLETMSKYGKNLLAGAIEPMAQAITAFIEEAKTTRGRNHLAVKFLELIEPDVAALIAARTILDGIGDQHPLQRVAQNIGGRIEDEMRFRAFEKDSPGLYRTVQKNLDKSPMGYQARVRRSTLVHAANKFGVVWSKWSNTDKVHLGTKLIDLFISAVGLVRRGDLEEYQNTIIFLSPTPELTEWISNYNNKAELYAPMWMPMVAPPLSWTNTTDGGYYHERLRRNLVKDHAKKGYLDEMKHAEMPAVYEAVNALQDTPWRVNSALLTVLKEIWEAGLEVKGVPSRFDAPLPAKPADMSDKKAYATWKLAAADVFRNNQRAASKRMQIAKIMWLADRYANEKAVWFPVQLDFRGRMYFMPQYLNPQGCDLSKALLTFAEGKPLGKRGAFWLAVHIANTFGNDKVSLEERAEWTKANSERIERTANDPLSDLWWTEADKPFQFLAACIEWLGYLHDGGENYVCSLPILVDGSCNGLQHFAAMLRDEVSGQHVNLTPAAKPADIYQEVANAVVAALRADPSENGKVSYAEAWIEYGISRKLCKRPVMILPYGGSRDAVRKYLQDSVIERMQEENEPHPFGDELGKAVNYLASVVWKVMGEVVVGPRLAMDWIRNATRVVASEGLPISWTTPTGFIVQQAYPELSQRRVKTRVGDEIIKLTLNEELDSLDTRRQVQAISPNFVHSLDASALVLTIVAAKQQGMGLFSAIHDSYGTLACDMDALQSCLRESFVEMYEKHDVLQELHDALSPMAADDEELPPVPAKGRLELQGVLRSDFFFA